MKQSLYHIETEYLSIINQVEELDGELTEELEQQLIINETQLQSKSIAYLEYIGSQEAVNTRIDAEIKRLQAMKKRNVSIVTKLRGRLLVAVKLFGAFEVGLTKFSTRKSTAVTVEDVNALPSEYKVVKITEQADMAEIKRAIKAGDSVIGCEVVENLNLKIN